MPACLPAYLSVCLYNMTLAPRCRHHAVADNRCLRAADPEDVLATLKRALDGREEALKTTKAVSEQLNREIG